MPYSEGLARERDETCSGMREVVAFGVYVCAGDDDFESTEQRCERMYASSSRVAMVGNMGAGGKVRIQ